MEMPLNELDLPHDQKTYLALLLSSLDLRIVFLDLQEICQLGCEAEAGLSPFINIPSIFQVPFQIPFGEIRKHLLEELAFISSPQLPQVFIILL